MKHILDAFIVVLILALLVIQIRCCKESKSKTEVLFNYNNEKHRFLQLS